VEHGQSYEGYNTQKKRRMARSYVEDVKSHEVGGVTVSHDAIAVGLGSGSTAEASGAQAKEVRNVSFLSVYVFSFFGMASEWDNELLTFTIVCQAELFAALQETKIKRWSRESLHLYCKLMLTEKHGRKLRVDLTTML
jgi:hypothetical protein